MVNTTTKMAYVDHDPNVISAGEIAEILNEHRFGAHIKKDCGSDLGLKSGIPTEVLVMSKFRMGYELRMEERKDRGTTRHVNVIEACLKERFSKAEELGSISIDASSNVLVVEHNP
jgi:hypothetical protein